MPRFARPGYLGEALAELYTVQAGLARPLRRLFKPDQDQDQAYAGAGSFRPARIQAGSVRPCRLIGSPAGCLHWDSGSLI